MSASPTPRNERGFSLIEIVTALVVFGVISTVMMEALVQQQRLFINQLDYGEAQQNGRAAVALIKRYVRAAGWGLASGADVQGAMALGSCYKTGDDSKQQTNCDNVDADAAGAAGSDRLRVLFLDQENTGRIELASELAHDGTTIKAWRDDIPAPSGGALAVNAVALISGKCQGGIPAAATDIVRITGDSGAAAGYRYNYQYAGIESGNLTLTCNYAGAAGATHNFGPATVADFFLDRSVAAHPKLMLRLNPTVAIGSAYVVAYDIDDFQVRYHLDVTGPGGSEPDGYADVMCEDLTAGGCAPTIATLREKVARVVSVDIAVVTRTRTYRKERDTGGSNITVQNHTFRGANDGYRRWVYRATVALRNNEL